MEDINNMTQNHPELIVQDLSDFASPEIVRHALKFRGVTKWLRVRRLLIQLKHRWKDDIASLSLERDLALQLGDMRRYHRIAGSIEMLADCRQQVRALCHSSRDVDFPHDSKDFGVVCDLPESFPARPHKRWLIRNNNPDPE